MNIIDKPRFKRSITGFLATYKPKPETRQEWRAFFSDWIEVVVKEDKFKIKEEGKELTEEETIEKIQADVNALLEIKKET